MRSSMNNPLRLVALLLCLAPVAVKAQNVETANKSGVTIKGFISATLFAQDKSFTFGNGQNAEFPAATSGFGVDPWFFDADVRNSRLNLTWGGPEVAGTKLAAVLETDFFGGFNGSGGFSNAQPIPRLRLAYVDANFGVATLRVGQAFAPWLGNVPVSLSHIAFPLGYGAAGSGGWRFPGLFVMAPLSNGDVKAKATLALMRNVWPGPGDTGASAGNLVNSLNAGAASGLPQVEARLDVSGKAGATGWSAYAVAHWDRKDLDGVGNTVTPPPTSKKLDGAGGEVGAKVTAGPLMVQGNAYYGKAMGHQFMAITQFGDIKSFGGWLQAGYEVTPNIAAYAFFGFDNPDDQDVADSGNSRRLNEQMAAMVRYKTGPYQLGAEWLRARLTSINNSISLGDQFSLSAMYSF